MSLAVRNSMSLVLNSEPSAATPMTVPTSRAVVVAEAAMPECLAGRRRQGDRGDGHHRDAEADAGQQQREHHGHDR